MANGIGEFIVEDQVYKYTELAPVEALRFGTTCVKVLGPALARLMAGYRPESATMNDFIMQLVPALQDVDEDRLQNLFNTALAHVYTPHNECLGNEAAFNTWFSARKSALFTVSCIALVKLVQDFFPNLEGITAKTFQI